MADFLGSYVHTLDDKGRLSIPAKLRREFSKTDKNKLIITRGLEGCLFLYPRHEWQQVREKLRGLSFTEPNQRLFVRMMVANANEISLDSQGRLVVPPNLREVSRLEKEVLIIGNLERVELWNPKLYDEYVKNFGKTFEEVAQTILF